MQRSNAIAMARLEKPGVSGWRATLSASCASLVGIGLARFAYTPILPAIIGAHWFTPSAAAYLGAANLAGYLAGALLGRPLAAKIPAPVLLRTLMLLASAAFFACAVPVSLQWFFIWRLLSGIAGGALMVLAAPIVLPHVPQRRRGVASGAIFAGVGLGIAASGTLVPLLLRQGLAEVWFGLGVFSLFLTLVAWSGWPAEEATQYRHESAPGNAVRRIAFARCTSNTRLMPPASCRICSSWSTSWPVGWVKGSTAARNTGCCLASAQLSARS